MKKSIVLSNLKDETGAVAIMVALLLIVFIGFAALAIDLGHLYVVRNELQNAADAGALAGARFLYNDSGTAVNTGANLIAYDAATDNNSEKVSVDVNWTSGNEGDVQRGHWSFAALTFEDNPSTAPVDLWNVSTAELDADPNFINAIKVVTRRQTLPAASFFARIFGHERFELSSDAVAYIGFAGTLMPTEVDQPIVICSESLLNSGDEYTCTVGRMINSGSNTSTHQTGAWTDFNQDDACTGGTNTTAVRLVLCADGNPEDVQFGVDMATTGGMVTTVFEALIDCWRTATGGTEPWQLTLPVVDCDKNNTTTCEKVVGAVTLNVLFISDPGNPSSWNDPELWPTIMDMSEVDPDGTIGNFESTQPGSLTESFMQFFQHFDIMGADGELANEDDIMAATIYFLPDCTPHEPRGVSGGENFGILAKIPVLVE